MVLNTIGFNYIVKFVSDAPTAPHPFDLLKFAGTYCCKPKVRHAMPNHILITCPSCNKKIRTSPEMAGMRGRCPSCGKTIVIGTMSPNVGGQAQQTSSPVSAPQKALKPKAGPPEGPMNPIPKFGALVVVFFGVLAILYALVAPLVFLLTLIGVFGAPIQGSGGPIPILHSIGAILIAGLPLAGVCGFSIYMGIRDYHHSQKATSLYATAPSFVAVFVAIFWIGVWISWH